MSFVMQQANTQIKGFVYGGTIVSAGDIGFHGRKEKESLNAVGKGTYKVPLLKYLL